MFIYELSAKFFSLFMSLVLFFNSFGVNLNLKLLNADTEITYTFSNTDAYSAAGEIEITSKMDGDYKLYWGDENEKVLSIDVASYTATYSEFLTVEVDDGFGKGEVYEFTAIPEGAETVLAYKGPFFAAAIDIPDYKIPGREEENYRFGALSDVHFNRYALSLTDDSMVAFPNALNFLKEMGISFVAMSGDLSAGAETSAYEKFNYIVSKFDFPVYTCTGNHDVNGDLNKEDWLNNVNTGVYSDTLPEGVRDVNIDTFDFVYEPKDGKGDVFIFLSQQWWSYNNYPDTEENGETDGESRILSDSQLDWLEQELEKDKDKTVYLFFHTFLSNMQTGEKQTGEGNCVNNVGEHYNLVYTKGTEDESRFSALMTKYKNVIFFNGHSHYMYSMTKYNPLLNITDYDGQTATMVHVSSVSSPRSLTDNSDDDYEHYMRDSEGYLVTVYDDYIILQGINFLKGKMLSYATYKIDR